MGRKYFQVTQLIKHLNLKYIKNFENSILRRQTTQLKIWSINSNVEAAQDIQMENSTRKMFKITIHERNAN